MPEPIDFDKLANFDELKQLSLSEQSKDFFESLKYIQKVPIDAQRLAAIMSAQSAFNNEKMALIENGFRKGFDEWKEFKVEWKKFAKHSNSPVFEGIKTRADSSFFSFSEAYRASVQALTYTSELNRRMAETLYNQYSGNSGIAPDVRREIAETLKEFAKINEKLQGYARLFEVKE